MCHNLASLVCPDNWTTDKLSNNNRQNDYLPKDKMKKCQMASVYMTTCKMTTFQFTFVHMKNPVVCDNLSKDNNPNDQ